MWDWIGFGAHQVPIPANASPEERVLRSKAILARALELGTTVAFVGAGLSRTRGYPSWDEFAQGVVEEALRAQKESPKSFEKFELERLLRFQEALQSRKELTSEKLMSIIVICREAIKNAKKLGAYDAYISETFGKCEPHSPTDPNPFLALAELPIQRFATTNYDCELERALIAARNIAPELYGLSSGKQGEKPPPVEALLSFTQQAKYCNQVAAFPIGWTDRNSNMVFHCHGRFDDPESIIAGEFDYQNWYLSNKLGSEPAFRQSIELLLTGNPLLFIGFGLRDGDLLHSLRQLRANEADDERDERPIFALLPEDSPGDADEFQLLYDRYGLNVIPFPSPNKVPGTSWAEAYCTAIRGIKATWEAHRQRWMEKPVFLDALTPNRAPAPYKYPRILDTSGLALAAQPRFDEFQKKIHDEIRHGTKVLVLQGPSGSGKTLHGIRLFDDLVLQNEFAGYLFWDANFSDDALTGREYLLHYLDPDQALDDTYLERIQACIESKRYLIVIEGVERMLAHDNGQGEAYAATRAFGEALKVFASPSSKSTVILISRLWPLELGAPENKTQTAKKLKISPIQSADLTHLKAFAKLDRSNLSALCGLLDGHAYGLLLAQGFLERSGTHNCKERAQKLISRLGRKIPEERIGEMIQVTIEDLDQEGSKLIKPLLDRLSVFISPFGPDTFEVCYRQAEKDLPRKEVEPPKLEDIRQSLSNSSLLLAMTIELYENEIFYSVHPIVREYLHKAPGRLGNKIIPSFGLNGLVVGKIGAHPGTAEAFEIVKSLFDELAGKARDAIQSDQLVLARSAVRRLLSLSRARLSTLGVLPWADFDEYSGLLYRLLALVKETSPRTWTHCSREDLQSVADREGVLFPGDLAWLYNELGFVLQTAGFVADAERIWSQGYDINRLIEGTGETESLGEYEQHSLLNLGHLSIDRGQLARAEYYLQEGRKFRDQQDPGMAGGFAGFQAIVETLRDDTERADELFAAARKLLDAGANSRGLTYFTAHHALLRHKQGRQEEISFLVRASRSMALREGYDDLRSYVDLAEAQELEAFARLPEAREQYRSIFQQACVHRDRKIECIVLSDLARIAAKQGDAEGSRRLANQSLRLANLMGLKSRLLRALLNLAKAVKGSGQRELARAYFKHVKTLAAEGENWLTCHEAEKELNELGEPDRHTKPLF